MEVKTAGRRTQKAPWYLYIIEADDRSLYTGITTDVIRRFEEHGGSGKGARYFNGRIPLAVRYVELCIDRSSASRREYQVKSMSAKNKRKLIEAADKTLLKKLF